MGFFLFILYLLTYFLRPDEQFPQLAPYRIMLCLGVAAMLAALLTLLTGKGRSVRGPQPYLMFGLLAVAVLSVLTHGWFGGGIFVLEDFGVTTAVFFMTLIYGTSFRRIRILATILVLVSVVIALQGILATHFGYGGDTLLTNKFLMLQVTNRHAEGTTADDLQLGQQLWMGRYIYLARIRGLGFLQDPNDLGQMLLVPLPFLGLAWRRNSRLRNFLLVYIPVGLLLYAIYLTRSRGAFVALLVLTLLAFKERLGRTRAIVLTLLLATVLVGLNVSGSRGVDDESAQERITAWRNGLEKLATNPILGVGYKQFTDTGDVLTAHNSFVLCFSELGLVGYFIWLTLLAATILELWPLTQLPEDDPLDLDFRRWAKAILLALCGYLVAGFFLSRTWEVPLYVILAMGAGLAEVARRAERPVGGLPAISLAGRVGVLEFASIIMFAVVVKLGI